MSQLEKKTSKELYKFIVSWEWSIDGIQWRQDSISFDDLREARLRVYYLERQSLLMNRSIRLVEIED